MAAKQSRRASLKGSLQALRSKALGGKHTYQALENKSDVAGNDRKSGRVFSFTSLIPVKKRSSMLSSFMRKTRVSPDPQPQTSIPLPIETPVVESGQLNKGETTNEGSQKKKSSIRRFASRISSPFSSQESSGESSRITSLSGSTLTTSSNNGYSKIPAPTEAPKGGLYSHEVFKKEGRRSVLSTLSKRYMNFRRHASMGNNSSTANVDNKEESVVNNSNEDIKNGDFEVRLARTIQYIDPAQPARVVRIRQSTRPIRSVSLPQAVRPIQSARSVHHDEPVPVPQNIDPAQPARVVRIRQSTHPIRSVSLPQAVSPIQSPRSVHSVSLVDPDEPVRSPQAVQIIQAVESVQTADPVQTANPVQTTDLVQTADFVQNADSVQPATQSVPVCAKCLAREAEENKATKPRPQAAVSPTSKKFKLSSIPRRIFSPTSKAKKRSYIPVQVKNQPAPLPSAPASQGQRKISGVLKNGNGNRSPSSSSDTGLKVKKVRFSEPISDKEETVTSDRLMLSSGNIIERNRNQPGKLRLSRDYMDLKIHRTDYEDYDDEGEDDEDEDDEEDDVDVDRPGTVLRMSNPNIINGNRNQPGKLPLSQEFMDLRVLETGKKAGLYYPPYYDDSDDEDDEEDDDVDVSRSVSGLKMSNGNIVEGNKNQPGKLRSSKSYMDLKGVQTGNKAGLYYPPIYEDTDEEEEDQPTPAADKYIERTETATNKPIDHTEKVQTSRQKDHTQRMVPPTGHSGRPQQQQRLTSSVPPGLQVSEAQPQQYWLGRFMTLTNAFHYEDSFNEPDIATGFGMLSSYSRPLSQSDADQSNYRVKRAFMVLENVCVTEEAAASLREFRDQYIAIHGARWML